MQSIQTLPKTTGETVRLVLTDGRVIAAYFNEDQRAWCWLNGHAGICRIAEADEAQHVKGWVPLTKGWLAVDDFRREFTRPEPEPKEAWFVWTKNGDRPRFAHRSEATALDHAGELAARNPGKSFLVLRATHKFRVEAAADASEAA